MRAELIVDQANNNAAFRIIPENDTEQNDLEKFALLVSERTFFRKPKIKFVLSSSSGDIIFPIG